MCVSECEYERKSESECESECESEPECENESEGEGESECECEPESECEPKSGHLLSFQEKLIKHRKSNSNAACQILQIHTSPELPYPL